MFLKRLKITYALYNFFHKKELLNNIPLYKKIGINKSYYSPVSSSDFKNVDPSKLQTHNFPQIEDTLLFKESDKETQNSLSDFNKNGFAILSNYIDNNTVDEINKEIDFLIESGKSKFKYINKIMFAIGKSKLLRSIGTDKKLQEVLNYCIQGNAKLFQSINFLTGSQQKTHSDSIHMTTFPLGGLLGVWIALEDVEPEQGALHYYPGSHTLPYYLNSDYDNEGNTFLIGDKSYTEYEIRLAKKVEDLGLEKKIFTAKKGDLLIWHANLLHGGEPHTNKQKTRKSMVFHYFNTDAICFHEITQRPALMKPY